MPANLLIQMGSIHSRRAVLTEWVSLRRWPWWTEGSCSKQLSPSPREHDFLICDPTIVE